VAVNHNVMRLVFALGVGLALSSYMYQRVTDPASGRQRAREEAVVYAARNLLQGYIGSGDELQIVDPLAPDRKVGKAYIYPAAAGWEVSGHYRRHDRDRWHAFLMQLDPESNLIALSVKDGDAALQRMAAEDPKFKAVP
jgi:hypothetical protein